MNNTATEVRALIDGTLPWDRLPGEALRYRVILGLLLLLCVGFIWLVETTVVPREDPLSQEIPKRFAQMVIREEPPPPPPPEPEEEEPEEEEPEEEPEEEKEPEPVKPEDRIEKARERAKEEVRAFEDSLAELRDLDLAIEDRRIEGVEEESLEVTRNLLTSRAGRGSGGITSGAVSQGTGVSSLAGKDAAEVESAIASSSQIQRESRGDGQSRRSDEQIRRVFDRYLGRINSAYQRALRANPALQGTLILTLEIAPSGEVLDVVIKSSELQDDALERRVLLIVRSMDFTAMPVEVWKGDYPINFFPS